MVLDEASTADLHTLVEPAKEADAKIVTVGDYRQLDAGGMFRLIDADTPHAVAERSTPHDERPCRLTPVDGRTSYSIRTGEAHRATRGISWKRIQVEISDSSSLVCWPA